MYSKNVKMFSDLVLAAVKCRFLRMQKMILQTDIFRLHCKMVLQTDFFRNKFWRTNILFGAPSCRLRYFSKDKRKTLWGHKYCYCGVEDKMMWASPRMWGGEKIENEIERLVKILTKCKMKLKSRREEIKWNCGTRLAAARVLLRSASSYHRFHFLSLHPSPPARILCRPTCQPPRTGRAKPPAILAPAVLPFLSSS